MSGDVSTSREVPADIAGIVVLGMHRSGTSVVTRVLNLLGARLGPESDFVHGPGNPDHWESQSLVACNDEILLRFGGSWDVPPDLRPGWERSADAAPLLARMRQAFGAVYPPGAEPWVWKDPRTCLTLPLWQQVLGPVAVVLVLRDPSAVIGSLRHRDNSSRLENLALWEHYTRSAVANAAGLPVVVVNFEALSSDPPAAVRGLVASLADVGVHLGGSDSDAAAVVGVAANRRVPAVTDLFGRRLRRAVMSLPPSSPCFEARVPPQPRWSRALLAERRVRLRVRPAIGRAVRRLRRRAVAPPPSASTLDSANRCRRSG
ncbi:MAG: sulfotransferase [Actinomycetota bacterium]|nr:sulfotransferase [Actinomycetota bacterium]